MRRKAATQRPAPKSSEHTGAPLANINDLRLTIYDSYDFALLGFDLILFLG